ncbi:protoporphyrinogen oxidase [Sedimenticola hydrogenitrophicus]|uniref:protoporphyrinogen oxidase n=1 Tax=Sedimenticola hydrogenitrophicus TaxID=2967975 RepID=UPI0023B129A5|nr:protoporphyrinogen oxidase [Sedimenticola hydrogenitrophicus]
MANPQVLIIGAGISGLSTAWWLARQGIAVEVWEADGRPGGKIQSTHEAGYLTERAAGLLVNFRPEIDRLVDQCGLAGSKRTRPDDLNRYVVHRGRLTAVPMRVAGLIHSPLWSWQAKLRLLAEGFIPRGEQPGESASRFITRRLGREVLETAFDPFIAGTLASDPALAEARSVLPRLTALEQRYGSITLGVLINSLLKKKKRRANSADTFSFQGGMSELTDRLSRAPGVSIRYHTRVTGIEPAGRGWRVTARSGTGTDSGMAAPGRPCPCGISESLHVATPALQVPQLVITTPADSAAMLLSDLDRSLSGLLAQISYAPVSIVHLGMDERQVGHPLDGTGFLVPGKEKLGFNGNLWMSRLFPGRAPEGKTLLTSYLGGARQADSIGWSDERIVSLLLGQLSPLIGLQGEADYIRVDRHPRGLPLYHGQHQARVEAIRARLSNHPGLHLTANYLDGVSVRDRIFQGSRTARAILESLPRATLQQAIRTTHALTA